MSSPSERSTAFNRRGFLALSGAATAAIYGVSAAPAWSEPRLSAYPFTLGVASGDPSPDGVVLWTRLAPDPLAADGLGGMPHYVVRVRWEIASDPDFRTVVQHGGVDALPELAHAVHVEVEGLRPGRPYWYRFAVAGQVSPVGRTRTAPARGSLPPNLRFALVSCQAWVGGRYAAYRAIAHDDLDLVVHVGDYIYEQPDDETLADFRIRHAQYKTSPDLQAAHAAFPFVVTFDDHEVENNWAGDVSQPDGEESNRPSRFRRLRANAFQAYYEHLPLRRPQRPHGAAMIIHRRLDWGRLARFHVLDTRQYRSDQFDDGFPSAPLDPRVTDPGHTLLGDAQERWLYRGLDRSPARWNVLAQQTIMAQVDYDPSGAVAVNHDQWDGYVVSRERLLNFVERRCPRNPVVLSGDWHSAWVNDLKQDFEGPGEVLATEFVGTSVSSGCSWADAVEAARPNNPHVRYLNARQRGYTKMTLSPTLWRADYRVVVAADDTGHGAVTDATWVVESDRPGAVAG